MLTLDFETEAIGPRPHAYPPKPVGYAWAFTGKSGYESWGHPGENNTTFGKAQEKLEHLLHRAQGNVIAHNAVFDREVCIKHMKLGEEATWNDTMVLAFLNDPYGPLGLKPLAELLCGRQSDEQDAVREWLIGHGVVRRSQKDWGAHICKAPMLVVKPYAIGDVMRTRELYERFEEWHGHQAYKRELLLQPAIIDMESNGVLINVRQLSNDMTLFDQQFQTLDKAIKKKLGVSSLDEDTAVAKALQKKDLLHKPLPLTEKGQVSTAKSALIECVSNKKLLGMMLHRNALATSLRTFMMPWYEQATAQGAHGRLYFKLNSVRSEYGVGTRTGRLSSSPNMMNVPSTWENLHRVFATLEYGAKLPNMRTYIMPDPGHAILALDYSQQEMRLFAHYEDGELMRAYQRDPTIDAHDMIAKLSGLPRRAAKTLSFAALYGAGLGVVMQWLECSHQEASEFRSKYNQALPGVKELSRSITEHVRSGRPIRTIGDRTYFPETPKYINGQLKDFIYKLVNYLIQGSAADQLKEAMVEYYYSKSRRGRLMFPVHDEIVCSAPIKEAEHESQLLSRYMRHSFADALDVEFLVDSTKGVNYGVC
jgi:DNA polymerase-1